LVLGATKLWVILGKRKTVGMENMVPLAHCYSLLLIVVKIMHKF